jgi:ubiquinone/menaquinone biosynthesis C-methylase UbiE
MYNTGIVFPFSIYRTFNIYSNYGTKKILSNVTETQNQYKETQRQSWNNVAVGWQEWWQTFEKDAQRLSDHLVELAKIESSSKVLDIATGIGEPSITAARKVDYDEGGHILATDIAPQMLSIAKKRAASLNLQEIIEFKEGDAETIDLPTSNFDAVLCRWGLMYLPDLKAGLSNIHRSLIDGGRLAAAVWASPDKVPFLSLVMSTVLRETQKQPPTSGTPGPFSLADKSITETAMSETGFKDIVVERMNVIFTYGAPEEYTHFHKAILAPAHGLLADQPPKRKDEVWNAVTQAVKRYADNTGSVKINNEVICFSATKEKK